MDLASLGFLPGFQPICCLGRQPDVAVKRSILATPMVVIYRYIYNILGVHFLLFLNVTFIELLFNVGGRLEAGIGDFCFTGSLLFFFLLFLLKNPKLRLAGHMLPPFFVPFLGFTDLFGPFLVKPEMKKKSFLKCIYIVLY